MAMDSKLWFALFEIFKMGGHARQVLLGTDDFGKLCGESQQTASRRLLQLVAGGYIARELTPKGQNITITDKGMAALREVHAALGACFEGGAKAVFINGSVFSGFGEGAYYVTKAGYKEQFSEKLGFAPFPGTLNLKLKSADDVRARNGLEAVPGITIKGFVNGERTYGDVKCFKVLINDVEEGAILMIHRTHYGQDVIELVAKDQLRKKYGLKDGDFVRVKALVD